jgi:hypothetical protein
MALTNNEKQAEFAKRKRALGQVPVQIWILPEYKRKLLDIVKELNKL